MVLNNGSEKATIPSNILRFETCVEFLHGASCRYALIVPDFDYAIKFDQFQQKLRRTSTQISHKSSSRLRHKGKVQQEALNAPMNQQAQF